MASLPILTLSDLTHGYDALPLFEGVGVNVLEDDRICLVGRNGSGKSTLLKIMAGEIAHDDGERFVKPGKTIAYMPQEPDMSAFETLGDYAASVFEPHERYRIEQYFYEFGLDLDRSIQAASGGEKRRASLAQLLAQDADLLLIDEPTNHLDIDAILWLERYLRQSRSAFVIISHDRMFLKNLTNATIWVDRTEIRKNPTGYAGFEDWRDHIFETEDETQKKLKKKINAEAKWAVEGISARRKRNQGRVRRLGDLKTEKSSYIKRERVQQMAFDAGEASGKKVIEARKIYKSYGDINIVEDFSIKITRSERIAFVGPNGAGKTTLLNMLIGIENPDQGTVKLGKNLSMAMFDQNRSALDGKQSLWDHMTNDAELGVSGKNDQIMVRGQPRHVMGYLKSFLFTDRQAFGPVGSLSGGERARLLLAKLMARESNLLVLDEPTNDLDAETLDLLQEVLDQYEGTVLLVSHDRDFIDRIATRTIDVEGDAKVTIHSGGWSDVERTKRKVKKAIAKQQKKPTSVEKKQPEAKEKTEVLSFKELHRLKVLPTEMEQLQAEIIKLETFLMDPDLFVKSPQKFDKATKGLADRQQALVKKEEEWLALEEQAASL